MREVRTIVLGRMAKKWARSSPVGVERRTERDATSNAGLDRVSWVCSGWGREGLVNTVISSKPVDAQFYHLPTKESCDLGP